MEIYQNIPKRCLGDMKTAQAPPAIDSHVSAAGYSRRQ